MKGLLVFTSLLAIQGCIESYETQNVLNNQFVIVKMREIEQDINYKYGAFVLRAQTKSKAHNLLSYDWYVFEDPSLGFKNGNFKMGSKLNSEGQGTHFGDFFIQWSYKNKGVGHLIYSEGDYNTLFCTTKLTSINNTNIKKACSNNKWVLNSKSISIKP
ncbi:hypothetical protein [Enterovibrio nigricans]|uniref:Lipoprotein n=1 Tax=Enterovibrio nigricans DSM 22720 TaxID=1121868 RepID=A0A1T4UBN1_9GAMM|nr:hypothetical protein [Enterovibrio nigricans]PKF51622.1 hypothetical protein AT251_03055 [Enterovibrio nigricans]SKA49990.1 hypothetical protein SAMN02745132_01288 [Enterovibrio nigricans DSM 22720]